MNFRKSQCFHVVLFSSNVYCEAFQKDSGKYAYIFVSTEKNTTVTFYLSTSNLMSKKHKDFMDEIPLSSKEQCSWNALSTQEDEDEEK